MHILFQLLIPKERKSNQRGRKGEYPYQARLIDIQRPTNAAHPTPRMNAIPRVALPWHGEWGGRSISPQSCIFLGMLSFQQQKSIMSPRQKKWLHSPGTGVWKPQLDHDPKIETSNWNWGVSIPAITPSKGGRVPRTYISHPRSWKLKKTKREQLSLIGNPEKEQRFLPRLNNER